ncbi:MAG: transketolase [Candidatus Komeilibacteria bacterium]
MKPTNNIKELALIANQLRQDLIAMLVTAGSGHTASPLALADLLAVLYFSQLHQRPRQPLWPKRDRLIFSAGHVVPIRYVAMARAGYFPLSRLATLRRFGSSLQGHPSLVDFPVMETSGGPLGQGISVAVGLALAGQLDQSKHRIYVVCSDAEMEEGQLWEAAMTAAKYGLGNLTAFLDRNNIQISGTTDDVMPLDPVREKWRSFQWQAISINGHDHQAIIDAINLAQKFTNEPTVIILNTVPGQGVSFMENDYRWHGRVPTAEEGKRALRELQTARNKIS